MHCTLCGNEITREPDGLWVDDEGDRYCRLSRTGRHRPDEWDDGGNILTAPAYLTTEV